MDFGEMDTAAEGYATYISARSEATCEDGAEHVKRDGEGGRSPSSRKAKTPGNPESPTSPGSWLS
jgi:hypothetical protein